MEEGEEVPSPPPSPLFHIFQGRGHLGHRPVNFFYNFHCSGGRPRTLFTITLEDAVDSRNMDLICAVVEHKGAASLRPLHSYSSRLNHLIIQGDVYVDCIEFLLANSKELYSDTEIIFPTVQFKCKSGRNPKTTAIFLKYWRALVGDDTVNHAPLTSHVREQMMHESDEGGGRDSVARAFMQAFPYMAVTEVPKYCRSIELARDIFAGWKDHETDEEQKRKGWRSIYRNAVEDNNLGLMAFVYATCKEEAMAEEPHSVLMGEFIEFCGWLSMQLVAQPVTDLRREVLIRMMEDLQFRRQHITCFNRLFELLGEDELCVEDATENNNDEEQEDAFSWPQVVFDGC